MCIVLAAAFTISIILYIAYYRMEDTKAFYAAMVPLITEAVSMSILLFCLAAEQGYADAILAVGECYYLGTGVEKDLKIAAEWYQKALDAGFEPRDEEEAEHLKELRLSRSSI